MTWDPSFPIPNLQHLPNPAHPWSWKHSKDSPISPSTPGRSQHDHEDENPQAAPPWDLPPWVLPAGVDGKLIPTLGCVENPQIPAVCVHPRMVWGRVCPFGQLITELCQFFSTIQSLWSLPTYFSLHLDYRLILQLWAFSDAHVSETFPMLSPFTSQLEKHSHILPKFSSSPVVSLADTEVIVLFNIKYSLVC